MLRVARGTDHLAKRRCQRQGATKRPIVVTTIVQPKTVKRLENFICAAYNTNDTPTRSRLNSSAKWAKGELAKLERKSFAF